MHHTANTSFGHPAQPGWFRGYADSLPHEDHGVTSDWAWMRWPHAGAGCWHVEPLHDCRAPALAGVMDDFGNLVPAVQQ